MGSRLKQNPERTFNWFFEATRPVARDKDPGVKFQFPEDFSEEESCQASLKFCFPYDIQRARDGVAVQHFTFVLTDLEGCQQFGFCRLTSSTQTCLCILSYLPWFEVFYKLLNNLADYLAKAQVNEIKALLAALHKQSIPMADGSITLQMLLVSTEVSHPVGHTQGSEGIPYFIAPDPRNLPSIPENRNLTELIVAVDVGNLLQLYASMLFERRILIFASKLSTLTSCVHALSAALYPMYWQHIFIPVLPPHLLDYCCAPMPYLIGVHTSLSEKVRSRGLEEVVILNVDTNTLETPFDDLKRIPSDVISGLKVCLKRHAVSPGCGVSRAFLKAQALLFGGYRDALQSTKEGDIHFSEELFLDHKSQHLKQFLQSAIHLQLFKQFIDARLDILNKGKGPDDLFEEEIIKCETTAGKGRSYQQMVGNLKKGGGAIILNMKTKANMRAKGFTKAGLKNLLINKSESLQRGRSTSHHRAHSDSLQDRLPITQHFGTSRPRRPLQKCRENPLDAEDGWDSASGAAEEPDCELQKDEDEGDDSPLCDSEEMDLLGEIFDTLSSRSSHDRGLLYGTRSLDLFGPDSHDYITKRCPANPSQESLSLSISGSGSLHSWNLETTEELSDLTEDSDFLCPDSSLAEEESSDSFHLDGEVGDEEKRQRDEGEKLKTTYATMNGMQEEEKDEKQNRNICKEVMLEDKSNDDPEEDGAKEIPEIKEDESQSEELGEMHKSVIETESKTTKEDLRNDTKESLDTSTMLDAPFSVEEHQGPGETTAAPEILITTADLKLQEATRKKSAMNEEPTVRPTPSPPKVTSAAARFQSPTPAKNFQLRSIPKAGQLFQSRENQQTQENTNSDTPEEEGHLPVKVSELKKRFEA
ncbi:DENN domain-containing protein 1B isoform X2 [Nothobranchius furzeri]|uniref:DENN domain-containing protein 1B isoform X2 n=1 Tax=Nothobranchius furzeri TaxID=105023 RepID=UPI003904CDF0